ncbi:hypothetical protein [uncultured Sphingomonas sp.]|uniref:hypothetical protein n=1 Tax=uncultured Sphingomonas sp. TaxID=158754 RepID=UPI0025E988DD|nr:hypothetical protein [uncultured Sphingomonas sp.]
MIRTLTFLILPLLTACSASEPTERNAAPAVQNEEAEIRAALANGTVPPLPKTVATPTKTLPAELIGTWTADRSGGCAPGNLMRIEITPTEIRYHESVARIESVVKTWPEGYGVDAQVTGEGQTERRSFDLIPRVNGTLIRSEAPYPDITYTRCKVAP